MIKIFLFASVAVCIVGEAAATAATLEKMFMLAVKGEYEALEGLEQEIHRGGDPVDAVAYPVALYLANPALGVTRFVEDFPIDREGVNRLYELRYPKHNGFFAYETLGHIAAGGNTLAIAKLFLAFRYSDASISSSFCESIHATLLAQSDGAIQMMRSLTVKSRVRVYSVCLDSEEWERKDRARLRANLRRIKRSDAATLAVIRELQLHLDSMAEASWERGERK